MCKNSDTVEYNELTINTLQMFLFISMSNVRAGKVSLSKYLFASSGDQLQEAKYFHVEKRKKNNP